MILVRYTLIIQKDIAKKNCNKCSQVCPCGAIKRLSLEEKQKTRIAMTAIKEDKCVKCGACVRACPYGAIKRTAQGIIIDSSKCIGCAKCKVSCKFDAIERFAIKKQSLI